MHAYGLGEFLEQRPLLRDWTWAWSKPDVIIIHGASCIEEAQRFKPRQVKIVPYGVDIPRAARQPREDTRIRVLYVGMHSESKGIFDLLATAHELRDLNIEFRLAGTYKYEGTQPRFESRLRELRLQDIVKPLGQRVEQDLWAEYAKADIFFFPTYYESETFGVVVIEAMANGLPVVASDWQGPKDIVVDGKTGYLCPVRDIQAYASAIRKLASNAELRNGMGAEAEKLYRERYTLDSFVKGMRDVFGTQERNGRNN
jgi:glycosyltransferase involved in cell wall biosynthesis